MPVPAVVAAYSVVGAVVSGFTAVVGFFAARMTAKVALVTGAVVSITALTVGLIAGLGILGDSLSASLPSGVAVFSAAVMPTNLNECVSVVIAAQVLRWAYDRHLQIVGMITSG